MSGRESPATATAMATVAEISGDLSTETAEIGGDGSPAAARIYVGGLSASVTAADIEKAFSSLGRVSGVEFVRKDDRNFAYMDFVPASQKSIAKLFSVYNGCTWKGGKLKLEKAKEHYLSRLKREWVEDTNHGFTASVNSIAEENAGLAVKPELPNKENLQLRIFFPKLRKVKSLPFKGTGKHKYSFRRIEVPALPLHFCDCEEHYDSSGTGNYEHLTSLDKVIHEKELRIMSCVMDKLFKKEDSEKIIKSTSNTDIPNNLVHDEEAEEAQEPEDDNLVTNIGTRGDDLLMQYNTNSWRWKKEAEEATSNVRPPPSEQEIIAGAPIVKPNMDNTVQSRTWVQKSSWKDLVGSGGGGIGSFSIANVVPAVNAAGPESAKNTNSTGAVSNSKKRKIESNAIGPVVLCRRDGIIPTDGEAQERNSDQEEAKRRMKIPTAGISDVCTFMRSVESEKEWAKAKSALCGSNVNKGTKKSISTEK